MLPALMFACVSPGPEESTPAAERVPVGERPDYECVPPNPRMSEGVDLGGALRQPYLAPTPTGWVVLRTPDDLTGINVVFLDVDGTVQEVVNATEEVGLPSQSARLVVRPDDFIVMWTTEFRLGWRTLSFDGELGPAVQVRVAPFTTPVSAVWVDEGLVVTVIKPGQPDRVSRYDLDGTVLAGPVEVPDSNRLGGVLYHDPVRRDFLHLHTIQIGDREELWHVSLDFDEGPVERRVIYEARTMHVGSSLERSSGPLVAFDDIEAGAVLLEVRTGEVGGVFPNGGRGFPALAEQPGCNVAVAVRDGFLTERGGVDLHMLDPDFEPLGTFPLLEVPPDALVDPHALAYGHERYAFAWIERGQSSTALWFHTIEL